MKYRNKVTGAVISTEDKIQGKDWELVKTSNPKPSEESPKEERTEPLKSKKGKK